MIRRGRQYEEPDETVELGDVLEPYQDEDEWMQEDYMPIEPEEEPVYAQVPIDGYMQQDDLDADEPDPESRFRIALGMFDIISILVGIAVILMLVAMLFTLYNWLRADVLNSALFLQSGMQ